MILGIYGSGSLGREVLELVHEIEAKCQRWQQVFFINDFANGEFVHDIPVLTLNGFCSRFPLSDIEVVIAVGEPELRKKLWDKLQEKHIASPVLCHPLNVIPQTTQIGDGTVIGRHANISCDIKIGENVFLQPLCSIGHDTQIGNHSVISTFATIAGHCHLEECVYLAMGVPVKQEITIGQYCIVGMGAVVLRDLPAEYIAMGNPARPIQKNAEHKVF